MQCLKFINQLLVNEVAEFDVAYVGQLSHYSILERACSLARCSCIVLLRLLVGQQGLVFLHYFLEEVGV